MPNLLNMRGRPQTQTQAIATQTSFLARKAAGPETYTTTAAPTLAAPTIPSGVSIFTSCDKLYIIVQRRQQQQQQQQRSQSSSQTLLSEPIAPDSCPQSPSTTSKVRAQRPTSTTGQGSSSMGVLDMPSSPTSVSSLPMASMLPENMTDTMNMNMNMNMNSNMNMGTATPSSSKTLTTAEMAGIAGVVLAALALVTLVIVLLRCRQWRRRDESLWSILLSEKRKHVKVAIPFWENSHPRRHGIDSFSNDRFSTSNSSSGLADGQPAMAQPDKAHGKPSSAPAISPLGLHVAAAASASSFLRLFTNSSARSQASNEKV